MKPVKVRLGDTFGKLTVIQLGHTLNGCRASLCECDCGNTIIVPNPKLVSKHTKSCGCLRGKNLKHGFRWTAVYRVWVNMRQRCTNSSRSDYKYYGGRGISVCSRWKSFDNFIQDMGEPPTGLTLDRINPDGNYESSNCRWASWETQNNNKSKLTRMENYHELYRPTN